MFYLFMYLCIYVSVYPSIYLSTYLLSLSIIISTSSKIEKPIAERREEMTLDSSDFLLQLPHSYPNSSPPHMLHTSFLLSVPLSLCDFHALFIVLGQNRGGRSPSLDVCVANSNMVYLLLDHIGRSC